VPKTFFISSWKRLNTDGARNVLQKQNRKLFLCQTCQHTREEDNTNALSVDKHHGCKEEGHLLNQFIKFFIKKLIFYEKNCV
jgi:hypothetical protein